MIRHTKDSPAANAIHVFCGSKAFAKPESKIRCLARAIITIGGLTSAEVRNAPASADHLSPLDFSDKKINSYRRFLSQKLGLTSFDCGRVVDDASLGPEGIVSVYSRAQNGRRVFYVTSAE